MVRVQFENRAEAGRYLATKLSHYANRPDVLVLALPRGGVPVAFEVAQTFHTPLDIFVVRKLGMPGHEEMAMGAIASGGVRVLNQEVVEEFQIANAIIDRVAQEELQELRRREVTYRGSRPNPRIQGRTVILVDDGLATGASMRAAVTALKLLNPAHIVVAVPAAARSTCEELEADVDEVICAMTPEPFFAVGLWYEDFSQTTDEEVRQLLQKAETQRLTEAEVKPS